MRCITEIAEVAFESGSVHAFHSNFIAIVTRALSPAGASIYRAHTATGNVVACNFDDPVAFAAAMTHMIGELTPEESARALTAGTHRPEVLYSESRRDSLHMFREYLRKLGSPVSVSRVWCDAGGLCHMTIGATPSRRAEQFLSRAGSMLDQVFPIVALAERLFMQERNSTTEDFFSRDLTLDFALTAAEHEVLALAVRGLTNPEIASVTGRSVNTVRNQVCSCFSKLGVTRRTEAMFVLQEAKREQRIRPEDALATYRRVTATLGESVWERSADI